MKLGLWLGMVGAVAMPLTNLAIAPTQAQEVNCKNPQTTREMRICSSQEAASADKKLNRIYPQLMSKLSGQQKQRMIQAQTAWINFRDATCAYEKGQYEGGTFAPVAYSSCIARLTKQRTQELQQYLLSLK